MLDMIDKGKIILKRKFLLWFMILECYVWEGIEE